MQHPPDGIRGIGSILGRLRQVVSHEIIQPTEDLLILGRKRSKSEKRFVGSEVVDDRDQVLMPPGHAKEGVKIARIEGVLLLPRRSKVGYRKLLVQIDRVGGVIIGGDSRGIDGKVGAVGAGPECLDLACLITLVTRNDVLGVVSEVHIRDPLPSGGSMVAANALVSVDDRESFDRRSVRPRATSGHLLRGGEGVLLGQYGTDGILIVDLDSMPQGMRENIVGGNGLGALHAGQLLEQGVVPIAERNKQLVLGEVALVGICETDGEEKRMYERRLRDEARWKATKREGRT